MTTTDLAQLESAPPAITETTSPDVCAEWLEKLQAFKAAVKEAEAALKARIIWWIQTTGQDIVIGDRRYYVGHPPTTKCTDPAAALEALLAANNGDLWMVAGCLASDAFKHGECRKALPPEVYDRLFETTRQATLKDGVAKQPQLLMTDDRFNR